MKSLLLSLALVFVAVGVLPGCAETGKKSDAAGCQCKDSGCKCDHCAGKAGAECRCKK